MTEKIDRVNITMDPEFREDLDEWRKSQKPIPPSAGAVRYIVRNFLDQWKAERSKGVSRRSGMDESGSDCGAPH